MNSLEFPVSIAPYFSNLPGFTQQHSQHKQVCNPCAASTRPACPIRWRWLWSPCLTLRTHNAPLCSRFLFHFSQQYMYIIQKENYFAWYTANIFICLRFLESQTKSFQLLLDPWPPDITHNCMSSPQNSRLRHLSSVFKVYLTLHLNSILTSDQNNLVESSSDDFLLCFIVFTQSYSHHSQITG